MTLSTIFLSTFWFLLMLWSVVSPLIFAGLLWYVRKSVTSDCTTDITDTYRFLWQDYNKDMIFWEVLDIACKFYLTWLVMFVDKEQGSKRVLWLMIVIIVSTMYLDLLALSYLFKRANDLHLSFTNNIILIGCFLLDASYWESLLICTLKRTIVPKDLLEYLSYTIQLLLQLLSLVVY